MGIKPANMMVGAQLDLDALDLNVPQAAIASLTDNAGGSETPDGTISEIADIALDTSNTYTDAAVNSAVNAVVDDCANAIEELAAKINAILVALRAAGIISS